MSYPLICGLLQLLRRDSTSRNCKLSYPLICGLLQHSYSNYRCFLLMGLSYPLICGLLQQAGEEYVNPFTVVIPTHMWASATDYDDISVQDIEVVIPTHMWASATILAILAIAVIELSYPLICGLLQLMGLFSSNKVYGVVIPTHMWASATAVTGTQWIPSVSCHTHSYVGFCNQQLWDSSVLTKCCHTHSYVGFCNSAGVCNETANKLSYPLICGLLQPVIDMGCQLLKEVVIPTHMWASATYGLSARIGSSISCHTHSYVGFCNFNNMGLFSSNKSCHTHSYVGFCNLVIGSQILK